MQENWRERKWRHGAGRKLRKNGREKKRTVSCREKTAGKDNGGMLQGENAGKLGKIKWHYAAERKLRENWWKRVWGRQTMVGQLQRLPGRKKMAENCWEDKCSENPMINSR